MTCIDDEIKEECIWDYVDSLNKEIDECDHIVVTDNRRGNINRYCTKCTWREQVVKV